jgi:ribonuclease BN (tRNA processing enzyme)
MDEKLKLTILGSCSGTEPMPGRHHTSIALEYDHRTYWFDAGENCAHAGHTGGVDLPATEAIFLSHTHIDHFGGMPNLLWTLGKLSGRSEDVRRRLSGRTIEIFLPEMKLWKSIVGMATEGGNVSDGQCFYLEGACLQFDAQTFDDGIIFDRHGVTVTALHNGHRGTDRPHRSFSFRVEAGGKAIVYSGDVKHVSEVGPLLDYADMFLMETGHHAVEDVCTWLTESGKRIDQLVFVHHGRAILRDPVGELRKARAIFGENIMVADDGMALVL